MCSISRTDLHYITLYIFAILHKLTSVEVRLAINGDVASTVIMQGPETITQDRKWSDEYIHFHLILFFNVFFSQLCFCMCCYLSGGNRCF